jgi:hydrogenase maturation protease
LPEDFVNIVGVGNVLMGDDGVGVAAVEALASRRADGVRLHDAGLAVGDVLGRLDPARPLIVLDALRCGGAPGSVYAARLDAMAPQPGRLGGLSLHELGIVPALQLEALSGRQFRDVTVFGVEPGAVAWGQGLSPPVAAALERLVEAVLAHVRRHRKPTPAGAPPR